MIVHYLWHGFPLCRFTRELPAAWPPGHRWVSAGEASSEVTCAGCRGSRAPKYLKGAQDGSVR